MKSLILLGLVALALATIVSSYSLDLEDDVDAQIRDLEDMLTERVNNNEELEKRDGDNDENSCVDECDEDSACEELCLAMLSRKREYELERSYTSFLKKGLRRDVSRLARRAGRKGRRTANNAIRYVSSKK